MCLMAKNIINENSDFIGRRFARTDAISDSFLTKYHLFYRYLLNFVAKLKVFLFSRPHN